MASLEDPGVHDVADRLAGGGGQGIPQILGHRVSVGVGGQVLPDPVSEGVLAEMLLEHPQDAAALLVGEQVEHPACVGGGVDHELDRAGRVQAVDGPCGLT